MTGIVVEDPVFEEIRFIMENLREQSREDVFGVVDLSPVSLAEYLHDAPGIKKVIYHDRRPAVFIGASPDREGVWSLRGMGTDDWINVWRLVTLVWKRDMMRQVSDAGVHRAHVTSPASHEDTHKWLRFLGASHEAELPQYGRNGEDYILFSWLKEAE